MKSSPNDKKRFIFGTYVYHYDLLLQERKTLTLTVTPDLRISVKCPHTAGPERVETFLRRKWFWLEKQLRFFQKYQRKTYEKEYLSGEGFFYLGRQYKLSVQRADADKVSLTKGVLVVQTTKNVQAAKHTKKLLDAWYKEKMQHVFKERFAAAKQGFDYAKMPELAIREMPKRWGSYVAPGKVVLNPKLIHASRECIDYVITHELCHGKYRHHNKYFYTLLTQKYPKWERVKERLELLGVQTD